MKGYVLGSVSKNKKSRHKKANKIIKIIEEHKSLMGCRVLDIGTGAGYIAHELSKKAKKVDSVDIVDDRIIKDGYNQTLVKDETLPFGDGVFDVVITNQVLEHVPDHSKHLSEIRRVLKNDGVVYLASPNKWWLSDPHYKLPFISWLPRGAAGHYLRIAKGRKWDIYSVSLKRLKQISHNHEFEVIDKFWDVLTDPYTYEVSVPSLVVKIAKLVPEILKNILSHVVPTHVKILVPRVAPEEID